MAEATNDTVLDGQQTLFADLGTWAGLRRWADALVELQEQRGGRGGCPIANLVAQVGEHDEPTRAVLAAGFDRWEAHIRAGLAAMVSSGELASDADVDGLAASTLASVEGGLMLTQAAAIPKPCASPSTAPSPSLTPTAPPAWTPRPPRRVEARRLLRTGLRGNPRDSYPPAAATGWAVRTVAATTGRGPCRG